MKQRAKENTPAPLSRRSGPSRRNLAGTIRRTLRDLAPQLARSRGCPPSRVTAARWARTLVVFVAKTAPTPSRPRLLCRRLLLLLVLLLLLLLWLRQMRANLRVSRKRSRSRLIRLAMMRRSGRGGTRSPVDGSRTEHALQL
jgi:hypothetical protein